MYWLTATTRSASAFSQCLVVKSDGSMVLLTRSADLRQARHTSTIDNVVLWTDRDGANPALDCATFSTISNCSRPHRRRYDTHGLTAANGRRLDEQLQTFGQIMDASGIVGRLRLFKSPAENRQGREGGPYCRTIARRRLAADPPGRRRGAILAAMQGAIFTGGGDYPANEFIVGSGADALLCRYKAGRRKLNKNDQLTLEWSGAFHHYHAPMMRTALTGKVSRAHQELFDACQAALMAVEKAMVPGNTFGDVFDAHAKALESRDLTRHRLNACGYSVGARFTPSSDGHADVLPGQSRADRAET